MKMMMHGHAVLRVVVCLISVENVAVDGGQETMSKTKSQTAMTAHGDVEYDTVSCTNCGNELLTDDAVFVGVGLSEQSCSGLCDETYETYRRSVPLCEFCGKETIGYTGSLRDELNKPTTAVGTITVVIALLIGSMFGVGIIAHTGITLLLIWFILLSMIPVMIIEVMV